MASSSNFQLQDTNHLPCAPRHAPCTFHPHGAWVAVVFWFCRWNRGISSRWKSLSEGTWKPMRHWHSGGHSPKVLAFASRLIWFFFPQILLESFFFFFPIRFWRSIQTLPRGGRGKCACNWARWSSARDLDQRQKPGRWPRGWTWVSFQKTWCF